MLSSRHKWFEHEWRRSLDVSVRRGVDEIDVSGDENINEGEEFDFEEIDFGSLNEDEVKKYRDGFKDKKNELVRKMAPRKETRCGCLARMKIYIDKEKCDWYVSYFVDGHNHELVGNIMVG
ncbi:hypothetical protein Lal_00012711 [Lupinus albus]|nr:hypothetical protein Lal_00012711 [Lupinus albus]